MAKYDACPKCGCDGVRPYDPIHKVTWDRLDGRCRRCNTHPAEHEVEVLTKRVAQLEIALALAAWHALEHDDQGRPSCAACLAADTKEDNCPVVAVVERLPCPFGEDAIDPLPPVLEALGAAAG